MAYTHKTKLYGRIDCSEKVLLVKDIFSKLHCADSYSQTGK